LDAGILINNNGYYMSILKKTLFVAVSNLRFYSAQPLRLGGMNRRANFASAGGGLEKARPGRLTPPCGAGMAARREKRYTHVCASEASRQMSRDRRRLFPTKFALLFPPKADPPLAEAMTSQ
jgi:hypothetical protein